MTRQAQRRAAQKKIADARGVLKGLARHAEIAAVVGAAEQIAHHRLVLAARRSLAHGYLEAAALYRPDSATQLAMLDCWESNNVLVARMQRDLDIAAGDR